MATWQTTTSAKQLITRDSWLALHVPYHVTDPYYWASVQVAAPPLAQQSATVDGFRAAGWLCAGAGVAEWLPGGLGEVLNQLRARHLPAVFAFVFDEFWMLSRRLLPMSRLLLGGACVALPGQWIWPTDASAKGGRGDLRPEVRSRPEAAGGGPRSVTYRLALSPAAAQGSVITLDPVRASAGTGTSGRRRRTPSPSKPLELRGELIAWDEARWHWDGRSRCEGLDCLACLEVEHQRRDSEAFAHPQVNPEILPSWEQRIRLIAQVLQGLGAREAASRHLTELGGRLLDALDRPGTSGVA